MRKPGFRVFATSAILVSALAGVAGAAIYTVSVKLDGVSEVPTNASTAIGSGTLTINDATNTITYNITHNVVGATASHIHGSAGRDKTAGVIVGFPSGTSPIAGSIVTTPANITIIKSGKSYVNVHSGAFPGGEIRGQVPAAPGTVPGISPVGMAVLAAGLLGGGLVLSRRRRVA